MKKTTIALLGAGSWGSAIAIHLAKAGHRVLLWGHRPEHIQAMRDTGVNAHYLPNIPLPDSLEPQESLEMCLNEANDVIIAVPSHAFTALLSRIPPPKKGIAWLTKGVDPHSNALLSECVQQRFGQDYPFAIISGPSFAKEVAKGLPTAVTIAGNHLTYQQTMQRLLHHHNLRVYFNPDPIGVQLCGTVKNVLAIASGISEGLDYGANAQAALITRGLAEMRRLGMSMGAQEQTFIGLAGLGDLVLTCTDNQSRNRRFGLKLGHGIDVREAEKEIGQVVEGKHNAAQVCAMAKQQGVDMPICEQVNEVLQGRMTPKQAKRALMEREVGFESKR